MCPTFCDPMDCSTPGFPVLHYLPEFACLFRFMSTESMMLSNHLILCHPFLLLPSISPGIRVFYNKSAHRTRWPQSIHVHIHILLILFLEESLPNHLSNMPCSLEKWLFILFTKCNILQILIRSCCLITLLKTSIHLLNFSTCITITEREELKFELYRWSFLFPPHIIYHFFISVFISSVFF